MNTILRGIALFSLLLAPSMMAHAQKGELGRNTTQKLMSAFNQAETLSSNVIALRDEAMPKEIAAVPAQADMWRKQTAWIAQVHLDMLGYIKKLDVVLSDSIVTRKELGELRAACSQINVDRSADINDVYLINKRRKAVLTSFNALCTNEVLPE
jgi:hypothetical protein